MLQLRDSVSTGMWDTESLSGETLESYSNPETLKGGTQTWPVAKAGEIATFSSS